MITFELITRHITSHILESIRKMVGRKLIGGNVVIHQLEIHKFDRVQTCDSDIISSLVALTELTFLVQVYKFTLFQIFNSSHLHESFVLECIEKKRSTG